MKNLRVWIMAGALGVLGMWYMNLPKSQPSPQTNQDGTPSDQEEAEQWKELRNNPQANKGKEVTWYLIAWGNGGTYYDAHIPGLAMIDKHIYIVRGPGLITGIHKDDNFIVKGKFVGIDGDGSVMLKPLEMKNLGVQ